MTLFLDAHTAPSPGSIRLLESVAREYGTAASTVDTLDPISWQANPTAGGAGGYVDLWKSWQCVWLPLSKLPTIGPYRERWSVPGETFAIRRDVNDAVGGWDRGLVAWGSDSSLSLRLWCLGFPIVHVPQARIAHLFRKRFEQYRPRWWQILANRWRMMTSLATPEEFEQWIAPLRTHSVWPEAMDYAIQHAHTVRACNSAWSGVQQFPTKQRTAPADPRIHPSDESRPVMEVGAAARALKTR